MAHAGPVRFAFLRTAEIGGSQKAGRRALAHAMKHAHESMGIKTHAGHMAHVTRHAHAHAKCHPALARFPVLACHRHVL